MVKHILRRSPVPALAILAGIFGSSAAFGAGVNSAKELVTQSGVKGGLVVHVGGGSTEWTAALRVNDRYLVQGLQRHAQRVAAARALLDNRNLLGPVTVIPWDGRLLPYADNMVNLLIVESPSDLTRDEIMRVLAPLGVAYVKSDGGWKKTAKPWPKEIDQWTHFLHGPDNNAVADDTRVAPPRHLQWVAGPRWARSHDHLSSVSAAVSAAGRLFYIVDEGPVASVKAPSQWMLVARDAFNGVLLWKKAIGPWESQLRPFRSGPAELPRRLVAVGDRVYVTLGYGKPVTALDAATGRLVRTYEGTANTHEIVADRGTLYLVVSQPLDKPSGTTGKVIRRFELWRGAYEEYVTQFMPRHVRAVDAETGKLLWKKDDKEVTHVLPLTLIVDDGRVLLENENHVLALKASSGELLWRAERPITRHRYAWSVPTLVVCDGVVLSADRSHEQPVETEGEDMDQFEWRVSANHILTGGEIMAFAASSGEKLWTAACHEGFNFPVDLFVVDGKVFSGELAWGRMPGITKVYDLKTGQVVARRSPDQQKYTLGFGHARCYRNKATSKYIIHGRSGVEFLDVSADRVIADHWVRGACQYGILPANGLIYAPSHSCACYITAKLNGFNALSGRRATPFSDEPDRLSKGPAYGEIGDSKSGSADPADWPTYRYDAARSGATTASLSPNLTPYWETALPGPLTAVVVAEGRLYVAQREAHTVHALNADDGSPLWHHTAGGRVDSPPTIHGRLVYFGSADGCIYCLRARDGELVWRFRVAPESRQIVSYGQLESVWPVHGNVLVCRDPKGPDHAVAYAVAGRSSYVDGGLLLCGVHARTGELLVKRRISHRDPKTGHEPQNTIKGVHMPGALPDILAAEGDSLFMRHTRLDFQGKSLPEDVDHMFTSAGYVDDSWWHRTYWQLGRGMRGGYGGWISAGNKGISGRLLVKADDRVFGFGRKGYRITGSHLGLQSAHHLFGADATPVAPPKDRKKTRRGSPTTKVTYHWSKDIPFYVRAMLLAGDTLLIAGPSNVSDFGAPRPNKPVSLWAVAADDGNKLAERKLKAAPVLDSFAVSGGRLYFTTVDGKVVCYRGQ